MVGTDMTATSLARLARRTRDTFSLCNFDNGVDMPLKFYSNSKISNTRNC